MLHTLLEGILLGLTVCFLIGPGFFALLQTSIHRGFKSGIFFAIGVVISDFTLIALSYVGALQVIDNSNNQFTIGIIGGIILVAFGIATFTRKVIIEKDDDAMEKTKKPKPLTLILKGYFMNIANPFLLIFWIGSMSVISSNYGMTSNAVILFFTGTLLTIFGTDILKCFVANKIKQYLNQKVLQYINHVVGIILVISGIILIVRVVYTF